MSTTESAAPRARGERAGLDRKRIVAVARTMQPADLTVQAVAAALGVDRKAVRHHVRDRDSLVGLVAWDLFADLLATEKIPRDADWRSTCRLYATTVAEATFQLGAFAGHLKIPAPPDRNLLARTEMVLRLLTTAGLRDHEAIACVVLLTNVGISFGRDRYHAQTGAVPLRPQIARDLIDSPGAGEFPHLRRILDAQIDTYTPEQLDLSLEIILVGVAQRFHLAPATGTRP